ncbi:UDP-ARABINOSE 4-EPIMERASE-RELATED [Salix purpurea]|uniref:UDP-ARABINOSE 4-EPIMERASE-RELATED n=1 Tax=Salix purpurea TaxID=77065 RepID=A0A9Q0WQ50_SALPP|nr:UDP-ARABINOSE 4-EPIMERASE-RELATED [Salix purpurea]
MLNFGRNRAQPRSNRPLSLGGMDYSDPKRKNNVVGKILLAATLTALCIIMLKQSPTFNSPSPFSLHEEGVTHVLVTGGAGYIGSHAAMRLLKDGYRVTIVDNLSRGNIGAVKVLQELFPEPGRLQFIYADLGDPKTVNIIFQQNAFDAVMHFAAVAYVGESTMNPLKNNLCFPPPKLTIPSAAAFPTGSAVSITITTTVSSLRYYHNITSNTLVVLEAMAANDVKTLIYSSTCATYGEPEKMPITEVTPQEPINPYGKAKKMAEDIILDFSKNSDMAIMILRYFNVIGSDPDGRLGEAPRPELREHGRISGACFDAARGITPGLKVKGTDYKTHDGTCIRDYIDVTDLVDAHVKALEKATPAKVGIYNVGTGKGRSVKDFVKACKKATGVDIKVEYLPRRPGDYAEVYSDPSKINRELNWTAQYTDLQKSLQTAWRWQKSHQNGYGSPLVMAS